MKKWSNLIISFQINQIESLAYHKPKSVVSRRDSVLRKGQTEKGQSYEVST